MLLKVMAERLLQHRPPQRQLLLLRPMLITTMVVYCLVVTSLVLLQSCIRFHLPHQVTLLATELNIAKK
jgi:hypothetical protein